MEVEIQHRPGNSVARVTLAAGEQCTSEAGAMIAMSGNMQITTTTHKRTTAGLGKAIKRMFSGESFFLNHFEPSGGTGELWLGTSLSGDMMVHELKGESIIVQSGGYVGSSPGVDMDFGWTGFKALLSGESIFWLKISGNGKVVLSSFGAIYPVEVDGEHIVDTGHIVAFDETLDYTITKAGKSWIHSFLGGEGLVCKFKGKGTVWCQSHNPRSFGISLTPLLRPRRE